jgi:hypothetical protein
MRIRTILAAAAAPAALAAVAFGTAGQASAATTTHAAVLTAATKATGSTTCGSTEPAGGGQVIGSVTGNLDVPAGTYCYVQWGEVTGNVSVEGVLTSTAGTFDRNVSVSGPGSQLWFNNYPSHIKGNLSVTGSSGAWNGSAGTSFGDNASPDYQGPGTPKGVSVIDGNMSFIGNTGWLYVGSPLTVAGDFTASGNGPYTWPGAFDTSGLHVLGHSSVS